LNLFWCRRAYRHCWRTGQFHRYCRCHQSWRWLHRGGQHGKQHRRRICRTKKIENIKIIIDFL